MCTHQSPRVYQEYVKVEGKIFPLELHTIHSASGRDGIETFLKDVVEELRPILQDRVKIAHHTRKRQFLTNTQATKPVFVKRERLRMAYSFKSSNVAQHYLLSTKGEYQGVPLFHEKAVVHACPVKINVPKIKTQEKTSECPMGQSSSSYFGKTEMKTSSPLVKLKKIVEKSGPKISKRKKRKQAEGEVTEEQNNNPDLNDKIISDVKTEDQDPKRRRQGNPGDSESSIKANVQLQQSSAGSCPSPEQICPDESGKIQSDFTCKTNLYQGTSKVALSCDDTEMKTQEKNNETHQLNVSKKTSTKTETDQLKITKKTTKKKANDPKRGVENVTSDKKRKKERDKEESVDQDCRSTTNSFEMKENPSSPDGDRSPKELTFIRLPLDTSLCPSELSPDQNKKCKSPGTYIKKVGEIRMDVFTVCSQVDSENPLRSPAAEQRASVNYNTRGLRSQTSMKDLVSDTDSDGPNKSHTRSLKLKPKSHKKNVGESESQNSKLRLKDPEQERKVNHHVFFTSSESEDIPRCELRTKTKANDNSDNSLSGNEENKNMTSDTDSLDRTSVVSGGHATRSPSNYDVYDFDLEPDPELSTVFIKNRINKESKKRQRMKENVNKFKSMEEDFEDNIITKRLYTRRRSSSSVDLASASFVRHQSVLEDSEKEERVSKALVSTGKTTPQPTTSTDDNPFTSPETGKTRRSSSWKFKLKKPEESPNSSEKKSVGKKRRRSKWCQLILGLDDESSDDLMEMIQNVKEEKKVEEAVETPTFVKEENLPVFNPVVKLNESEDQERAVTEKDDENTQPEPIPEPEKIPPKDRPQPIDLGLRVKSVDQLSGEELTRLVENHKRDLLNIFQGKASSRRHQDYKKGGKERSLLKYQIPTGCYEDDQHDVIMDVLIKIFCKKHHGYLDYVLKVMLPEALIMVYMDVHHTDAATAEAAMTLEAPNISFSDFL